MENRKTIYKWIWVWDFEKEEQWLNTMALDGWVLDKVGLCCYHFKRCEPGEYTIRLEMHEVDDAYLSFMKETNAEYIGRVAAWIYFRKKTEHGEFDIFSDIDSRIKHLKKISRLLLIIGVINILIGLANTFHSSANCGFINLLCASLLMYGLGRFHEKLQSLKNERALRE